MMVIDQDGRISLVNAQVERIFGHCREVLMGLSLEELVPQESRTAHSEFRTNFFKSPAARPMGAGRVLHGLHRSGHRVPVEIGLTPLETSYGRMILASVVDITERQVAERELRESEARHRDLFNHSPVALLEQDLEGVRAHLQALDLLDPASASSFLAQPVQLAEVVGKARTVMANQQALQLLGASSESVLRDLHSFFTTETHAWFRAAIVHLLAGNARFDAETRVRTLQGDVKVVSKRVHILTGHRETWSRMVVSFFDLTAHKQVEERLRASLREKDVLLKEVHHRVKNNLQIVSSLLNLKAEELTDPATLQVFEDCQARVRSLAILHEQLYASGDLSKVPFGMYVRSLVGHLNDCNGSSRPRISADVQADDVPLALDDAIPCGLIVNELVTNALKHAFPDGREGVIAVCLRRIDEGRLELTVRDNGVGLPPGLEPGFGDAASTGLELVFTFAEQLRAQVELLRQDGTTFIIRFAPSPPDSRAS